MTGSTGNPQAKRNSRNRIATNHSTRRCDRWTTFNARHGGKFEFHHTPPHASWVNQVEMFFSILSKRVLKWGNFHSTQDLAEKIAAFIGRWNE